MTTGDPQFLKKLALEETVCIEPGLKKWIKNHLLSDKHIHASKTMDNKQHRYDLEIDNDTHWALVKIGAEHKIHYETYAEEVLKAHVKQHKLGQQTKD